MIDLENGKLGMAHQIHINCLEKVNYYVDTVNKWTPISIQRKLIFSAFSRQRRRKRMEFSRAAKKPHAVCFPLPFQGHINALLKIAKILHSKGFFITFVNTEFNHQKLLQSSGPDSQINFADFQFRLIPDGLPPSSDINATQDIAALCCSISRTSLVSLRNLINNLNHAATSSNPVVSCIISDVAVSAALDVAQEFGIPGVVLWPMSAFPLLSYLYYQDIHEKILISYKDEGNVKLDTLIDFIPGMTEIRLRDLPSYFWDGNDKLNNFALGNIQRVSKASGIIINTFDALESMVLDALKSLLPLLPPIYTIGPLQLLEQQIPNNQLRCFRSNLLEEHQECIKWLDSQQSDSVVYVNFGSTTVMSSQQLIEFAWGLANSKCPFLWVIRADLVTNDDTVLPPEFMKETVDQGMISGWCPQEQVLCHSATGGFLTHSGWNSTMDTICGGVPVISWPFFGDQQGNCRHACVHWGIGMELNTDVRRDEVEKLVRELMEGEKGKEMREKTMEWKNSAEKSTNPGGSSYLNLDKVVREVLVQKKMD